MASGSLRLFGVQTPRFAGKGREFWFRPQYILWERKGLLYTTYFPYLENGESATRFRVENGLDLCDGRYLFMDLYLDRDCLYPDHGQGGGDDIAIPLHLPAADTADWFQTEALLKFCEIQKTGARFLLLGTTEVWARSHPKLVLLANPETIPPAEAGTWSAWGWHDGSMVAGPIQLILDKLKGLYLSPEWEGLTFHQKQRLKQAFEDHERALPERAG